MSNETKKTALPKLRFPEFQGAPEWEEKQLGEVSEIVRGGSPRPIEDFITADPDGLNWLKIGDVAPEAKYIFKTQQRVIWEALSKTREVSPGDLILSNSMSFGRPYIMKTKSCIHDGWIAIRHIADNVLTDYLYYAISSESSQSYFVANAAGAAVLNLNAERIKVLPLAIPSIKEQQKIAATLSSLDDLLTAQNAKLASLLAHKRGLMQGLFPAEGETVPKLRFPAFQDAGEWVEKTLGEVAKFRRGSFPQPYGLPEWYDDVNGMPFIQVFDVDDNFQLKPKTKNKISQLAAKQSVFIPKETVIITLQGSIGRVAITQYDAYIDRTLLLFENFLVQIDKVFFSYVLFLLFEIEKETAPGGIIKTITKEVLSDFKISVPTLAEQQKIADCLSSLDHRIAAQRQQLAALKRHKQGLMQHLFPAAADPTA